MGAEENSLRNKDLYKIELYLLKVMPMLLATIYLVNTVLSYYDIIIPVLSYIGGLSLIPLVFMYTSSYVFRFCSYHRMFLHYIVVNDLINLTDYYYTLPISDWELFILHMSIAGVSLFIILYLYVKGHSKNVKEHSRQD